MKCRICDSDMELFKGIKWICSNQDCVNVQVVNKKLWYQELAANDDLWNKEIMEKYPSIIAYEYSNIYNMMKAGEVSGINICIKDMYEVLLKFPVLIILSEAFSSKEKKELYNKLLINLTFTLPSLGKWCDVARDLCNIIDKNKEIYHILYGIVKIYDKYNIINWRNSTIGHGAFISTENDEYKEDLKKKIEAIAEYTRKYCDDYNKIKLQVKYGKKFVALCGKDNAKNIGYNNQELHVEFNNKRIKLMPLLKNIDKGIYFFDSYIDRKKNSMFLNYATGIKINDKDKSIVKLVDELKKISGLMLTEYSAEDKIYMRSCVEALNETLRPKMLQPFSFIKQIIEDFTINFNKGYYLLQMADGMGKTTFVKMMDTLAYNDKMYRFGAIRRAFYINPTYSYSKKNFVQCVTDSFRITDNGDTFDGEIPSVDINSKNAPKQFANLLNTFLDLYKKYTDWDKIILFIDGIDELPNDGNGTLVDILPDKKDLNDGIYFVITCRNDEQISSFTRYQLNKFSFDKRSVVEESNNDYKKEIYNFIIKNTKGSLALAEKILAVSNNKILNVVPIINSYVRIGDTIFNEHDYNFFDILKQLYGEQYCNEIVKVARIISILPISLPIESVAVMLGEEEITFKLLVYLGELKSILNVKHESTGTLISITREEIVSKLNDNDYNEKIVIKWINDFDNLSTDVMQHITEKECVVLVIKYLTIVNAIISNKRIKINSKLLNKIIEFLSFIVTTGDFSNIWWELAYNKINSSIEYILNYASNDNIKIIDGNMIMFSVHLSEKVSMMCNDNDNAVTMLEKIKDYMRLEHSPKWKAMLLSQLGTLYARNNNMLKADKCFEEAGSLDCKNTLSDVNNSDGNRLLMINDLIKKSIYLKNDNCLHAAKEALDEAEKYINELGASRIKESNYVISLIFNVYKSRANIEKRHNIQMAKEYFAKAKEHLLKLPINTTSNEIKADFLLNEGQNYRKLKEYDLAIKDYDEALLLIEDLENHGKMYSKELLVSLYNSRGNINRDLNNHEEAIKYFTLAIDNYHKFTAQGAKISKNIYLTTLSARSQAYEALNMIENMNNDRIEFNKHYVGNNLSRVTSTHVDNEKQSMVLLASANDDIYIGRIEKAIAKLTEAIYLDKNNSQAWSDRAYCYSETKMPAEAESDTLHFILLFPADDIQDLLNLTSGLKIKNGMNKMDLVRIITYSNSLYAFRRNHLGRALLYFHYGWYLNKIAVKLDFIGIPGVAGKVAVLEEKDIMKNVIYKLKSSYERKGNDKYYAYPLIPKNELATYAEKILQHNISNEEKKQVYFSVWFKDAADDEMEIIVKMYSDEMIAYDLMITALLVTGNKEYLKLIANMYESFDFLGKSKERARKILTAI